MATERRFAWRHSVGTIDEADAKISVYDSALMFGDMVFEMTRSFNHKHFMLGEHIDRLLMSCRMLHIDIPMTKTELVDKCNHISSVTNILPEDEEHRLMINVTRGYLPIYHDVACYRPGADVIITDFPLRWTVKDFSRFYKNDGVDVKIVRQKSIPSSICEINKIKNRSRLHFAYANLEVSHLNWVWPLLTDPDGYLTENPGANIFLIKNNVLYTPEPRNILRGISRDFIMSLNKIYGLECVEKNLEPFDLYTCDEAFFTGTPFCIMPIRSADNHVINKTCGYGYYTQRLIKRWIDWVDCDFIHQMRRWDGLK